MTKPRAIGIHIYAGGFTAGLKDHFDIKGQWEEGDWGSETFELNFPKIPHPKKRDRWPIVEHRSNVELVYTNPPCAPWSAAGSKLGLADPRVEFTDNCVNTGLELQPDFFVWESVCRAMTQGRPKVEESAKKFIDEGYAVTALMTNTVLHGAAQARERFHFIAHKYDLDLKVPEVLPSDIKTVRDVIGDLEFSANIPNDFNHYVRVANEKERHVLSRLGQGEGWEKGYERAISEGLEARKARFITGRLIYDAPSWTMVDISAVVHPTQDRGITIREAARLGGYPDWFKFYEYDNRHQDFNGARKEDVTQAVMPVIGDFLGKMFNKALDLGRSIEPGFNVVDWRPYGRRFSARRYQNTLAEYNLVPA